MTGSKKALDVLTVFHGFFGPEMAVQPLSTWLSSPPLGGREFSRDELAEKHLRAFKKATFGND